MTMMNATPPMATSATPRRKTSVQALMICDPTDDRCVTVSEHEMLPGISVRHSPSCTGQICNIFGCDGGNWRVTNNGTLDRSEWIKGWAMTQLFTPQYMDCEEHPLHIKRGGWWADSFRGDGFISGSKLYSLNYVRGGARNELLLLAQDYASQALQYLIGWGIAKRINTSAEWLTRGHLAQMAMHLHIDITGPGITSEFTVEGTGLPHSEWLWKAYRPPRLVQPTGRLYGRVMVTQR